MRIALLYTITAYKQHIYSYNLHSIAICLRSCTQYTAFCTDAHVLRGLMHSDKLIISVLANNPHLA